MEQVGSFLIRTLPTGAAVLLLIGLWWEVLFRSDQGRRGRLIEGLGLRGYTALMLFKFLGVCAASAATVAIWWYTHEWWTGLAMLAAIIISPQIVGMLGLLFIPRGGSAED